MMGKTVRKRHSPLAPEFSILLIQAFRKLGTLHNLVLVLSQPSQAGLIGQLSLARQLSMVDSRYELFIGRNAGFHRFTYVLRIRLRRTHVSNRWSH